jgi:beta-glucosidase
MSVEEKVGFMLISTASMKNERGGSSEFNEEDRVSNTNMFTRKPLPTPMMSVAGTTKGVTQFHLRHFIFRGNVGARVTAEWTNKIQALCESDGLGIPAIFASNPRNHITKDAAAGLSVGKDRFLYLARRTGTVCHA